MGGCLHVILISFQYNGKWGLWVFTSKHYNSSVTYKCNGYSQNLYSDIVLFCCFNKIVGVILQFFNFVYKNCEYMDVSSKKSDFYCYWSLSRTLPGKMRGKTQSDFGCSGCRIFKTKYSTSKTFPLIVPSSWISH